MGMRKTAERGSAMRTGGPNGIGHENSIRIGVPVVKIPATASSPATAPAMFNAVAKFCPR